MGNWELQLQTGSHGAPVGIHVICSYSACCQGQLLLLMLIAWSTWFRKLNDLEKQELFENITVVSQSEEDKC